MLRRSISALARSWEWVSPSGSCTRETSIAPPRFSRPLVHPPSAPPRRRPWWLQGRLRPLRLHGQRRPRRPAGRRRPRRQALHFWPSSPKTTPVLQPRRAATAATLLPPSEGRRLRYPVLLSAPASSTWTFGPLAMVAASRREASIASLPASSRAKLVWWFENRGRRMVSDSSKTYRSKGSASPPGQPQTCMTCRRPVTPS
mmetsp:Transcript_59250/g.150472  ORF Transcript_59250/g.150472 Transcript_59250/m.150472 type:complete len:201 (-) Transcript_59250:143-745(-)